ncbi:MAG TPA: NAD-dependent epimerase/dehydratase family protein [Gemmatimonadetes bacterium]|nr:NAD-dependent epimerase/dehydratase family protein [Gemmatimonadota bacterium]
MAHVLVTGAAGLLGSHLTDFLILQGHKVTGLDNLSGGYLENVNSQCNFIRLDLTNASAVDAIMKVFQFDYVYHFAAYAAVGLSPFIRNFNYQNNVLASVNLINGCIKYDVRKFIFASSMDVYGEQSPPFEEDMVPRPTDPYGIAKYAVEMDLQNAGEQFGLNYTIIRPHNVIGPRQNIWDRYRNVAGIWIRKAMTGDPLTIYGDGTQRRAFSDVKYYMDPFYQLMRNELTDCETINIGADQDYSINELAEIVQNVAHQKMGIRPRLEYLEPRNEVHKMWCNHDKAVRLLDFVDSTDLYKLVEETWEWAKDIKPKPVKDMDYEIEKNMYSYWRKSG